VGEAAYDQERFISTISAEKKQAEVIAQNAIEYAQQVEMQAQAQTSMAMPLSASEEAWVEESAANPAAYAYQAARVGNVQLYNAVIENVAMENPAMAAQIGTQVNMSLQQEMAEAQQAAPQQNGDHRTSPPTSNSPSGGSASTSSSTAMRCGEFGLGQYHPYTLAVMGGDPMQRDLAVSAVYDLIRQGQATAADRRRDPRGPDRPRRRAAPQRRIGRHRLTARRSAAESDAGRDGEVKRKGQWTDESSGAVFTGFTSPSTKSRTRKKPRWPERNR
jgi:hypothetical protein